MHDMRSKKNGKAGLRITTLSSALFMLYGAGFATSVQAVPSGNLLCKGSDTCTVGGTEAPGHPAPEFDYEANGTGSQIWAAKGESGAVFELFDNYITGMGNNARGIGATGGSRITVDSSSVDTFGNSGGHVLQSFGAGSAVLITRSTVRAHGNGYSVGVLAQEGGQVDGTDLTIETNGTGASGVEADRGGVVNLTNGSITTKGARAAGVRAHSGKESGAQAGTINLDGTSVATEGNGATALLVGDTDGAGTSLTAGHVTVAGSHIGATGAGSTAARVQAGSSLSLERSTLISTQGAALYINGEGATAYLEDTAVITDGEGPASHSLVHTVRAGDGARVTMRGGTVQAQGTQYTRGLYADTEAAIDVDGTMVNTAGDHSHAVHAFGKLGESKGHIDLKNSEIATLGYESSGVYAQNGGSISTDKTKIVTGGSAGFGAFAYNGGGLSLQNGSIHTVGGPLDPDGRNVGSHGVLSKKDSTVLLNAMAIVTDGDFAQGLLAESEGVSASQTLIAGTDVDVLTLGSQAHGASAVGSESLVHLSGGNITTRGSGAAGVRAQDGGEVVLKNVNVLAEHGHGASIEGEDSQAEIAGGTIEARGEESSAIYMRGNTDVDVTGATLRSAGATITSVLDDAGQAQSIALGDGVDATGNNGVLLKVSRTEQAMDGMIDLTLAAGSKSAGDIVDLDGLVDGKRAAGGTTNLHLDKNAIWTGEVRGISDVKIDEGGTFTADKDSVITGNFSASNGAKVSFLKGADIGGDVSISGTELSFAGPTTIGYGTGTGGLNVLVNSSVVLVGNTAVAGNVSLDRSTLLSDGPIVIGGDIIAINSPSITLTKGADIGGSVSLTGTQLTLGGPTTIGYGAVTGELVLNGSSVWAQGQTKIAGPLIVTGGSELHGGTTSVPIEVEGNVRVDSSTLRGNLLARSRLDVFVSLLSPGNSIGLQTFGSVGEIANSTYHVEVNAAGESDKIIVNNGDIDVSGLALTVGQEDGTKGYRLAHDYSILETKNGKVLNEFSSATLDDSLAKTIVKLDPVNYGDRSNVTVSLSVDDNKLSASRSSLSANQNATLDGVVSVAGKNAAADAAVMSPNLGGALDQLSGEAHAGTQSALLNSSALIVRTLSNTLRANSAANASTVKSNAHPLWAQVVGNWNSIDGNSNAAKVKQNTAGLFIGGDVGVGGGWRVGGAMGYTDGRIKVDGRDSKSDVSSYTAALYGANSWEVKSGHVNFLLGAAYTRHDIDTRRHVTLGGAQTLKADYKANSTQLFTELGYALPVGLASVVEPYLGVAWVNQRAKSFTESGGAAALSGDSRTDDVTTFTLGLRGKTSIDVGATSATLSAGAGWRHASGDVEPSRRMALIQGNGAAFSVSGAPIAKNAGVLDLGAEVGVGKNAALGLNYTGQFGNGVSDNAGSLYLRVRFD